MKEMQALCLEPSHWAMEKAMQGNYKGAMGLSQHY